MTNETLQKLHATATVAYTEVANLAQDLTLPQDEYPLAQIIEVLDDKLCPLCEYLHGKIIQRGTPEWEQYRLPSHINCRRTFAYIPADAQEEPDFEEPPPSLLQKHGHFHTDPHKYEELRVPAFADRRQFIFRRYADPERGGAISTLQWLIDPEGAAEWWRDNLSLRDLFEYAHIPQKLPIIKKPRSAEELTSQYQIYQQYYANIYTSIHAELTRLDNLAETTTNPNKITEYSARAGAIRRAIPTVIARETKDLQTLFSAPNPMRKLPPHTIIGATPDQEQLIRNTLQQTLRYLPRGHNTPTVEIAVDLTSERSYYENGRITLGSDFLEPATHPFERIRLIYHEYAHHLEQTNPEILSETIRLYRRQTTLPNGQQEPLQSLRKVVRWSNYHANEMTRPDKFPHAYMGKWYADAQGNQFATEIPTQFYDYLFFKLRFIQYHREIGIDPSKKTLYIPKFYDEYLNLMFEPHLIELTKDLWRVWHRL